MWPSAIALAPFSRTRSWSYGDFIGSRAKRPIGYALYVASVLVTWRLVAAPVQNSRAVCVVGPGPVGYAPDPRAIPIRQRSCAMGMKPRAGAKPRPFPPRIKPTFKFKYQFVRVVNKVYRPPGWLAHSASPLPTGRSRVRPPTTPNHILH
jgi:hypothetical protein